MQCRKLILTFSAILLLVRRQGSQHLRRGHRLRLVGSPKEFFRLAQLVHPAGLEK
jgi:hypothetical protein